MKKYYIGYRLGYDRGLTVDGTPFFRIELTENELCEFIGKEVIDLSSFRREFMGDRKLNLGKLFQEKPEYFDKPEAKGILTISLDEFDEFLDLYENMTMPKVHKSLIERYALSSLADRQVSSKFLASAIKKHGLKPEKTIEKGKVYRLIAQNYGWGGINAYGLFKNVNRKVVHTGNSHDRTKTLLESANGCHYALEMENVYLNSDIIDLYESFDRDSDEFQMLDLILKKVLETDDVSNSLRSERNLYKFD